MTETAEDVTKKCPFKLLEEWVSEKKIPADDAEMMKEFIRQYGAECMEVGCDSH